MSSPTGFFATLRRAKKSRINERFCCFEIISSKFVFISTSVQFWSKSQMSSPTCFFATLRQIQSTGLCRLCNTTTTTLSLIMEHLINSNIVSNKNISISTRKKGEENDQKSRFRTVSKQRHLNSYIWCLIQESELERV